MKNEPLVECNILCAFRILHISIHLPLRVKMEIFPRFFRKENRKAAALNAHRFLEIIHRINISLVMNFALQTLCVYFMAHESGERRVGGRRAEFNGNV